MSLIKRYQQKARQTVKEFTKTRVLILMYHRVANLEIDPWALAVTPENFDSHLSVIKKHAHPISLREISKRGKSGYIPERSVVITFDDGYTDNLKNAKPIIDSHQIPATVFIATGYCGHQREFWWDELENILFQPRQLPKKLALNLNNQAHTWELGMATHYTETERELDRDSRAWDSKPGTRMHLYHSIWNALINLPELEREKALTQIIQWAGYQPSHRPLYMPMNSTQLVELESTGWIKVGAHTVHHTALARHPLAVQRAEILQSKEYLERTLGHSVRTFSYPFGNHSKQTVSVVRQAGFTCACTTVEDSVWRWSDRYRFPRFGVPNWDEKTFESKLLQWFNE